MVADGFPNAALINIQSCTDYLRQERIICALEDLAPNTDIFIDFGSHDIKKFYYTIQILKLLKRSLLQTH